MRVMGHILLLSSLLFSIGAAYSEAINMLYPAMFILTALMLQSMVKRRQALIRSDYYGTDQDCWENSTLSERHQFKKAYWAAHVRGHIGQMLETTHKSDIKLRWIAHRMDKHFG